MQRAGLGRPAGRGAESPGPCGSCSPIPESSRALWLQARGDPGPGDPHKHAKALRLAPGRWSRVRHRGPLVPASVTTSTVGSLHWFSPRKRGADSACIPVLCLLSTPRLSLMCVHGVGGRLQTEPLSDGARACAHPEDRSSHLHRWGRELSSCSAGLVRRSPLICQHTSGVTAPSRWRPPEAALAPAACTELPGPLGVGSGAVSLGRVGTQPLIWCLPASCPPGLARPSEVEEGDSCWCCPTDRAWKEVFHPQEEEEVTSPEAMCREGAPEIL